jgi:hypothetical protein
MNVRIYSKLMVNSSRGQNMGVEVKWEDEAQGIILYSFGTLGLE